MAEQVSKQVLSPPGALPNPLPSPYPNARKGKEQICLQGNWRKETGFSWVTFIWDVRKNLFLGRRLRPGLRQQ